MDPGILTVLREEIVPRLERDAPGQPSNAAQIFSNCIGRRAD
jgi:hypothetical protein